MASDEDTELRDLVAQTLERRGVLGKLRAQMRANVFLALEEHDSKEKVSRNVNPKLQKFLASQDGRLTFQIIRELLEFFDLEYTQVVLLPEANLADQYYCGREAIARDLNIVDHDPTFEPLLTKIIRRMPDSPISPKHRASIVDELSTRQISDARRKFDQYDKDGSGTIDKDELRSLFVDVFPHFNRNMLERYVSDEFKAADNDFSSTIEFSEFLEMYKRLFILCKAKVSEDVTDFVAPTSAVRLGKFGKLDDNQELKTSKLSPDSNNADKTSRTSDGLTALGLRNQSQGQTESLSRAASNSSETTNSEKGKSTKMRNLPELPETGQKGTGSSHVLPALATNTKKSTAGTGADWLDLSDIDKKINELGFGVPNDNADDYEDDFVPTTSSNASNKSIEDASITEEIEEDITDGSQASKEASTTDRTVTPTPDDFDYIENAILTS